MKMALSLFIVKFFGPDFKTASPFVMTELKALMTKEATPPRFILTEVKVVMLQHVREKSMTDAVRASSTNTLTVAVVAAGGI